MQTCVLVLHLQESAPAQRAKTGLGMNETVSVVVPVFNAQEFVVETIESAVRAGADEIVAVNDGSRDGSLEILLALQSRISILKVVDQANSGEGAAINAGLKSCTGRYVIFLSADDLIYREGLEAQRQVLSKRPDLAACYPDWKIISDGGDFIETITTNEFSLDLLLGELQCLPGPGAMIKVASLRSLGFARDVRMRFYGDLDQWIRLSSIGSFQRVAVCGAAWRLHSTNTTHSARGAILLPDLNRLKLNFQDSYPNINASLLSNFRHSWHRAVAISMLQHSPFTSSPLHALSSLVAFGTSKRGIVKWRWTWKEFAGAMLPIVGYFGLRQQDKSAVTDVESSGDA